MNTLAKNSRLAFLLLLFVLFGCNTPTGIEESGGLVVQEPSEAAQGEPTAAPADSNGCFHWEGDFQRGEVCPDKENSSGLTQAK
jgi:hypothetical protein